jgi:hypothetical protein
MWLMTPIGFFSIVEKAYDRYDGTLTVRARVEASQGRRSTPGRPWLRLKKSRPRRSCPS